jgi:glutathione synthase/RimK-type ligase-like ATP-grasp enzyme
MMLGIHSKGNSFSQRWIVYCEQNALAYKIVDCYQYDIISQLNDCDALMWHFYHGSPKDILFAKQLLYAVAASGKKVFPDFHTMWHFDDKVGQKYLLEAIGAPMPQAWVFYDKQQAVQWAGETTYPVVFKLRGGAGSTNVLLVDNQKQAARLIRKSFGGGFSQYPAWGNLKERIRKYRLKKTSLFDVIKGVARLAYPPDHARVAGRERGYVYFQEFIPGNEHDIRVIVIEDKAFALKRMVREGDFRASGSGDILYEKENFDGATVDLAFTLAKKLNSQCVAFDFVYQNGVPLVVEISYGFTPDAYDACAGYWDRGMNWHEGPFNPYGWMIENLIQSIEK